MFALELFKVNIPLDGDFPCAFLALIRGDFNKIADEFDIEFPDNIGVEHEGTFQ